jgi:hypothetical protein
MEAEKQANDERGPVFFARHKKGRFFSELLA